jgi:hypothetical protein
VHLDPIHHTIYPLGPTHQLYATQVIPFVDMTVKGWVWYQGENNMGNRKGNSLANTGYSCEQRELIRGWREVWSETPGTTGTY